jgi:hypothetical protein
MTKQMPKTIRSLDLASLAAVTGGMQISLTPKPTLSTGSSTTTSGQPGSVTSSPTATGSSGPQLGSTIQ